MSTIPSSLQLTRSNRNVNWRSLSEANVDSIIRRGDVHSVLSFADDVTYGNVGELNVHPTVSKAFKLSQLTVQYLLHTQQVLSESGNQADAERAEANTRLIQTKSALKLQKENTKQLKREHARQEELIESYRALLHTVNPKVARRADREMGRSKSKRRRRQPRTKKRTVQKENIQEERKKTEEEDEEDEEDETMEETMEEIKVNAQSAKEIQQQEETNETEEERQHENTVTSRPDVSDDVTTHPSNTKNMLIGVPEVRSSLEIEHHQEDPIASMMNDREEDERRNREERREEEAIEAAAREAAAVKEKEIQEKEKAMAAKRLQAKKENEAKKEVELALEKEKEELRQKREKKLQQEKKDQEESRNR